MDFTELSKPATLPSRVRLRDEDAEVLRFAAEAFRNGGAALATLVEIRGGTARAIGSQMAIAADGRFCGYVSGGCVEAAVAAEALLALSEGKDRVVEFGSGSQFFDIVLPCGGGIVVAIHIVRSTSEIDHVVDQLRRRLPGALSYSSANSRLTRAASCERTSWVGGDFVRVYRPKTRLLISGSNAEADAVWRVADAAGFDVLSQSDRGFDFSEAADDYSAIVLLHHDVEKEIPVLQTALQSQAFYIGALGSERTHGERTRRLEMLGIDRTHIHRIKAPIGIFGPARDANSLALSIVADVAATRLASVP